MKFLNDRNPALCNLTTRTFTIRTPDPLDVVRQRLTAEVEPETWLRGNWPIASKPYLGWVKGNSFQIRPAPQRRNDRQPLMQGHLNPSSHGTTIRVRIELISLSSAIICTLVYSFTLILAWQLAAEALPPLYWAWVVFMPILAVPLEGCSAWFKAHQMQNDLAALLQNQTQPPKPILHQHFHRNASTFAPPRSRP